MLVKTSELQGAQLDWAVAISAYRYVSIADMHLNYAPSTNWSQGGPIIDREGINLSVDYQDDALSDDMVQIGWKANLWNNSVPGTSGFMQWAHGPTPLIAAMRCYCCSKLGDEIDIPEELCQSM